MNAEQRKRILSIPGMRFACDFLVNFGNRRYQKKQSLRNRETLKLAKNLKTSDSCFIVGSGPSLTVDDLEKIAPCDCFGANHIFNLYKNTTWRPKYYVLQDRYTQLDRLLTEIDCGCMFLGSYFLRKNSFEIPDYAYVYYDRRDLFTKSKMSFSEDLEKFISVNYTVTYTMIQIAVALGYKRIYLIGMDHSYAVETDDLGRIVGRNNIRNHAYDDKQEVVANVIGMNRAYETARAYADATDSVEIYNVSRGGKLEIFPRMRLEEALLAVDL